MLFVVSMVLFVVTTDTDESFALQHDSISAIMLSTLSRSHCKDTVWADGVGGTAGGVGGVLGAVASHSDPEQHPVTMSDIVRSNSSKSTVDTFIASTQKFIK